MKCEKCGFVNGNNVAACVSCGNPLNSAQVESQNVNNQNQVQGGQPQQQVASQPVPSHLVQQSQTVQQPVQSQSKGSFNYFKFVLSGLLKPVKTMKEEMDSLDDTKTSIIFAALVSGLATILFILQTIVLTIYKPATTNYFGEKIKAQWTFSNLKELKWLELIFKNFFIFAGIIVAIALIYFLAGLIIKKEVNFKKLLGVSSLAFIPVILGMLLIAPLLGKLWFELYSITTVITGLYGISILIYGLNKELKLDDNDFIIYVHVICLAILIIGGSYIATKTIMNGISIAPGLDFLDF